MKSRVLILFLSVAFTMGAGPVMNVSAQEYCDPALIGNTGNPLGYRDRGGRCEGLYVKQVASTTLLVASLTQSVEQFNPEQAKPLLVEWDKTPGNGTIRLRAQGIRRRLYYRMDALRKSGETTFSWPSNVLASLNIGRDDLGVLASTQYQVGDQLREVYIPLRIRQDGEVQPSQSYKLTLLPGVELTEVYVSLARVAPDGRSKQFLKDGEKLEYGYYPAERGIAIPISGLKEKGTYYMEIGATLKDGGTASLQLWFYNSII
jgi:hypothetical protein